MFHIVLCKESLRSEILNCSLRPRFFHKNPIVLILWVIALKILAGSLIFTLPKAFKVYFA